MVSAPTAKPISPAKTHAATGPKPSSSVKSPVAAKHSATAERPTARQRRGADKSAMRPATCIGPMLAATATAAAPSIPRAPSNGRMWAVTRPCAAPKAAKATARRKAPGRASSTRQPGPGTPERTARASLSALAELSTRQIAESVEAAGMAENAVAGKKGGRIAKRARLELERKTGRKVVTGENYLPPPGRPKRLTAKNDK